MRVLFLSAWCPYPADNGSKLRIYHLLRGLGRTHSVHMVSFCPEGDDGAKAAHLRDFCSAVDLLPETPFARRQVGRLSGLLSSQPRSMVSDFSPRMAGLVDRLLATCRFDVVIASQLHMVPYALRAKGLPLVLEELELALLYDQVRGAPSAVSRLRHGLTWWKMRRYLGEALRRFAGYSVVSDDEAALAARVAPAEMPSAVVSNGVDVEACAAAWSPPDSDLLIYPGALSYDANFDAVAHFLRAILPHIRRERPNVRLRVTGRVTPEQVRALPAAEGVEFTGYLDDVRPAVARAWAEVVPLRKGGGTRLKVLEALALGTPVVSTAKGVEGLDLCPGQEVLVADAPEAFAAQTVRLLGSPALRQDLAERGRRAAVRYDWSRSVERLADLLERVVARRI
ncbi:MAG: glycosyltransferase [Chloroflexales bacterium]|nr:glycosyltransferase [Chloroflexales bacterium]